MFFIGSINWRDFATRRPSRDGLTLVEVLVASTLLAALLMGLWGLINVYTSLADKGQIHAARVRLAGDLMARIASDLQSVASPRALPVSVYVPAQSKPSPPDETDRPQRNGTPSERELATPPESRTEFSTRQEFRTREPFEWTIKGNAQKLEIARFVVTSGRTPSDGERQEVVSTAQSSVPVPESRLPTSPQQSGEPTQFKTVIYRLEPKPLNSGNEPDSAGESYDEGADLENAISAAAGDAPSPDFAGVDPLTSKRLIRLEQAWGSSADSTTFIPESDLLGTVGLPTTSPPTTNAPTLSGLSTAATAPLADSAHTTSLAGKKLLQRDVFEDVSDILFRYWDGMAWQLSWDSRQRGRLPQAIEVRMWWNLGPEEELSAEGPPSDLINELNSEALGTHQSTGETTAIPSEWGSRSAVNGVPATGESFSADALPNLPSRREDVRRLVLLSSDSSSRGSTATHSPLSSALGAEGEAVE